MTTKFQPGQRVFHRTLFAHATIVGRLPQAGVAGYYVNREGSPSDPRGYTNKWSEHYLEAAPLTPETVKANPTALDTQIGGDHYKSMKIQPIEYAMANKLNPCEFNVVKYVSRHRNKNGLQDLIKAKHMIDVLIALEYTTTATTN